MDTQMLVVQLSVTVDTGRVLMASGLLVPAHRGEGLLGLVSRTDLSLEGLQLSQKPRIRIDLHKPI